MLIHCSQCGNLVASDAISCPHCGAREFRRKPIKIQVSYTLHNTELIDNSVFYDGYGVQRSNTYISGLGYQIIGLYERNGESQLLYGGTITVSKEDKPWLIIDERDNSRTISSQIAYTQKPDIRGWHPISSGNGEFLFAADSAEGALVDICISSMSIDSYPRQDIDQLAYDHEPQRVTCIFGDRKRIRLKPSTQALHLIIDIEQSIDQRKVPCYKLTGLLRKKAKLVKEVSIPIYRYVLSDIALK